MHPRIAEVLDHVEKQRDTLRAVVATIPPDKHAVSPMPGAWSILGVLEHLSATETRIIGLLQKKVVEAREAGLARETETSPIMPGMGLERLLDRSRKLSAPEAVHPTNSLDLNAAWAALDKSRAGLHAFAADVDGLALKNVMHSHLYFGPLDVYTWLAFIGSHEARHTDQIREISASLPAT